MQHDAFEIKAMAFEIAEHFFDPNVVRIGLEDQRQVGQIVCQPPGFIFSLFPVSYQVGYIALSAR